MIVAFGRSYEEKVMSDVTIDWRCLHQIRTALYPFRTQNTSCAFFSEYYYSLTRLIFLHQRFPTSSDIYPRHLFVIVYYITISSNSSINTRAGRCEVIIDDNIIRHHARSNISYSCSSLNQRMGSCIQMSKYLNTARFRCN